jgi:FKBP-type peptidyl-prolyl cis-trans isomerase (trigger factor)
MLYYIRNDILSYGCDMSETKTETITFRIDAALKDEFAEIAEEQAKPVGELLRELVREHIKQKKRREFEAEARRQSLLIAAAAQDPDSDEAAVMRELEAHFADVMREWK